MISVPTKTVTTRRQMSKRISTDRIIRNEFLYRSWDTYSHMLRAKVILKEKVDLNLLTRAVQKAKERYPYFCKKVLRRGDDYEIVFNEAPAPVYEGSKGICLGSDEANGHFFSVCCKDRSIWIDLYHSMTDMKGLIPFLKTVVYLYLKEKYGIALSSEGIRVPGEDIPAAEYADPFEKLIITEDALPLSRLKPVRNFFPDSRYAKGPGHINYHIRISEEDFMRVAKRNDASPSVLIPYYIKEMINQLFPDRGGLPVTCGVSHSLRDICIGEDNFHDQVTMLALRYDDRMDALPMETQLICSRGQIILQSDPENMIYDIKTKALFTLKLDALNTAEERRSLYKNSPEQIVNNPETFASSYVGKISWGSIEPFMEGVFLSCSALVAPLMTVSTTLNGYFSICFIQRDNTDVYAKSFVRLLKQSNIYAEIVESEPEEISTVTFPRPLQS